MICCKCGKEVAIRRRSKIDLDFVETGFEVYLNCCVECGNLLLDALIAVYDKWSED